MKVVEMYHRKYVICDEFQNDSGCYVRRIAENYPNHPDLIEEKDVYGRKCKYRFVRHAFLELEKEIWPVCNATVRPSSVRLQSVISITGQTP